MSDRQRKSLRRAVAFAIGYQMLMLLIVILAGADVSTTGTITTFKATFTIGVPMLDQLLDPRHQFNFSVSWYNPLFLFWTALTTIVYAWANGFFIALLARSTDDWRGSSVQQANRSFLKLLLWSLAQMGVTLLCMPLVLLMNVFGGILTMVLLLWFRYTFMFFEYTVVVQGAGFVDALDKCRFIRASIREESTKYFWGIVIFNIVVAFLVNAMFYVPTILFFLLFNAIIMTLTQHNLLRIFNRSAV